jgi:hygromycin-B 7''-O-kinase
VESRCAEVAQDLGADAPEVVAAGEIEGWPYLVLRRLRGARLDHMWPDLDAPSRAAIAEDLGAFAARLHALPLRGLGALPGDWAGFVREQRERCVERHRGAPRPRRPRAAGLALLLNACEGIAPRPRGLVKRLAPDPSRAP